MDPVVNPAIVAQDLVRTFTTGPRRRRRTVEAVRGVTFRVEAGERLAFIGPNGAGKSTSIKMLTGILWPTAGTARVLDLEPWTQRRQLTRRIGTLFGQRSQLWPELGARASYRMLGAIHGLSRHQLDRRLDELGHLLEAADLFDQPVRTLSLGQRMRCELAACLLHQPEMLILDEPTIGLDLLAKQTFRQLLVRLNTEVGSTVFLTSHDVADIEQVADRAIVVNHGSIIYDAPVAAMRRDLLAVKRVDVHLPELGHPDDLAPMAEAVGAGAGPGLSVTVGPGELRADVDTSRHRIDEIIGRILRAAPVAIADLSVVDPPLEDVIAGIYQSRDGSAGPGASP